MPPQYSATEICEEVLSPVGRRLGIVATAIHKHHLGKLLPNKCRCSSRFHRSATIWCEHAILPPRNQRKPGEYLPIPVLRNDADEIYVALVRGDAESVAPDGEDLPYCRLSREVGMIQPTQPLIQQFLHILHHFPMGVPSSKIFERKDS